MIGKLYLIPTTLGDENPYNVLPADIKLIAQNIKFFIVENSRSARRFLKKIDNEIVIDDLAFFEINKRTRYTDLVEFLTNAENGNDIGLLSEAGCPGVADPGADAVKVAHQKGIDVKPLVGPSSILLALMASGMNGQSFSFIGYLPIKHPGRGNTIKFIEQRAVKYDQTHLFIETPYRNNAMMTDLTRSLDGNTRLCVACDLTLETEYIKTKTIYEWRKELPDLHKRPTIFIIGK